MTPQDILSVWQVHNRINLSLIKAIPAKGFDAVPSGSRGRTVAAQLVHMNAVRLAWLRYHQTGKRADRASVTLTNPTRARLKKAFTESGKEIEAYLAQALEGSAKIRAFKTNPVRWMGYLISHESHHRGSILLALKQSGCRIPDERALKDLWMVWMWEKD